MFNHNAKHLVEILPHYCNLVFGGFRSLTHSTNKTGGWRNVLRLLPSTYFTCGNQKLGYSIWLDCLLSAKSGSTESSFKFSTSVNLNTGLLFCMAYICGQLLFFLEEILCYWFGEAFILKLILSTCSVKKHRESELSQRCLGLRNMWASTEKHFLTPR